MNIGIREKRKILFMVALSVAGAIIGIIYSLIHFGSTAGHIIRSAIVGAGISIVISIFEGFIFEKYFRKLNFASTLIIRISYYVIASSSIIIIVAFFFTGDSPLTVIRDKNFLPGISFSLIMCTIVNFLIIINRMMGRKLLINFVLGKYHKPVEEEKIFMFLDINDSTTIAEKIGHVKFHELLSDFFFSLSIPISESNAEIYQYVGDEVVIVWNIQEGIRNANCIRVFFESEKAINAEKKHFEERYGFVPVFKAGLHCGKVVIGEIGDVKRDISYIGDVVNTTARIRTECGHKSKKFLISGTLLTQIRLPEDLESESLGEIQMKGKEEKLELFSIRKKQD